ncbi:thioredoxin domain-containing protein 15 [Adelges cooleyi]|uniref:thioredoxin domain-containing protein 15 n=1 Tax=Adelges cooleyi TaxID=133065 RepID=UPI00217F7ADE|nr:thioredoxin domain-containing protein 15 [Adelges cooleyi]
MSLTRLTLLLVFFALTSAESDENLNIDDSQFAPLEPPDSPKNTTSVPPPQMTELTEIQAVSNAIKNFQKKLEEEHNYLPTMQAYLTTSTASDGGQEFKLSSFLSPVLYPELVTDTTNSSQPSVQEPLSNVTATNTSRIVNCTNYVPLNLTEVATEVVNSTRLGQILKTDPEVINRHTMGTCALVLFYAKNCQFSSLAAPHYNVLPRIFPQVKMVAFNAISEQRFNTMYGITGVPTLILFHNGRPIAKYNGSDYSLYEFTKFIIRHTDLAPNEKVEITVTDFVKPVNGFGNRDYDYSLWLAWFVIVFWILVYMGAVNLLKRFVEDIKNIWREAEAQHDHAD